MAREIILDTETTGFDPKTGDRLVEIGCIEVVDFMPTGRSFHEYCDPLRDMPAEAQKVHGLSIEFLTGKPKFHEIADAFLEFVGDSPVIAHNAAFDISVMRRTCELYGMPFPEFDYICTVQVAKNTWPDLPSAKLNAVCDFLGVAFKHHDAAQDAFACGSVALAAVEETGASHIRDLPGRLGMVAGRLNTDSYTTCSSPSLKRRSF